MNWLIDNWYVVVGLVAILGVVIFAIYKFAGLPSSEKFEKVKKWLLAIVIEAERIYGSKTGKAKLSYVYGLFVKQFPFISMLLSFGDFSKLVDSALEEMKQLLIESETLQTYIHKD